MIANRRSYHQVYVNRDFYINSIGVGEGTSMWDDVMFLVEGIIYTMELDIDDIVGDEIHKEYKFLYMILEQIVRRDGKLIE